MYVRTERFWRESDLKFTEIANHSACGAVRCLLWITLTLI